MADRQESSAPPPKRGLQGETSATLPRSTKFVPLPPHELTTTQQSTQTVRGDADTTAATGQASTHKPEDDDPQDSDEETRVKGSHSHAAGKQAKRRYTIEQGEYEEDLLLTEIGADKENNIFAKVQNIHDFVASIGECPEQWCNAIRNLITTMIAYQETNTESRADLLLSRERVASLTQQLKEANAPRQATQENIERVRDARNTYRARYESLCDETSQLREEVQALKEQVRLSRNAQASDPYGEDPDDSDRDTGNRPRNHRRSTAPPGNIGSRLQTPATGTGTAHTVSKSNNKYPDVPDFYGNEEDRHTWESWRMHLQSKFQMSWELFENELSKILYIRDHCKDIAFNIVKSRTYDTHPDPYTASSEMIQDLENQFGEYDKETKADAELHNPKFAMGAKDPKESFDAFYTRFTAAIVPINMSDREKTSHLKRLISVRLRYKILDFPLTTSHRELVSRLRQVDIALRLMDDSSPRGARGGGSSSTRGGRGGNYSPNNNASSSNSNSNSRPFRPRNSSSYTRTGYRHPLHVQDRLRKEGRCFKCLKPGHTAYSPDAPCKDKPYLDEKQVTAALSEVGVENTRNDTPRDAPPTYDQQLSEN